MVSILLIVLFISLNILIYHLISLYINVPSVDYEKYLKQIKKSFNKGNESAMAAKIKTLILSYIRINPDKRDKLQILLNRCGRKITPEEYYLNAVSKALMILGSSAVFIVVGIPLAAICTITLSILVYFQQIQSVVRDVEKVNREILNEMPGFIRSFSLGLQSDRDIVSIIEKYRSAAGSALSAELDILLTNMKTGNHEEALRKFDERLNIEPVSAFVSGIIGISRGIDYRTFFYMLEENMKVLSRENLKREVSLKPGKLKKAIIAIVFILFVLYMAPIVIQLKDGFNIFK